MRAMQLPPLGSLDVYNLCVTGIKDLPLRTRFIDAANEIFAEATTYATLAAKEELFSIVPDSRKNEDIVLGRLTKAELKNLYSYYMVGATMPARSIYNQLIASAPSGICPLCGVGCAVTLDHYLPKSKYPAFSVLPQNLVPACRDCNTGKSAKLATTAEEQSLHPYFDHATLNEQWLFASVEQSSPPVINFMAQAPQTWPVVNQRRVMSHFDSLQLGSRFSVLAANELASLRGLLNDYVALGGTAVVKEHLSARARAEFKVSANSWKGAMFQALSSDHWYCTMGFSY